MKTSLRYYLLLALLLMGLGSCEKLTEGYDINPNAPQDAPADQQLTAVQVSEGFVLSGEMARTAGLFSDFFTGTDRQYEGLQNYTTVSGDYDNMWSNTFTLVLANARIVTQKAEAVQNFQLTGIAQVLEAQMIGMATSVWGDIPYSQALQPGQPAPFDRQSDIYASVQTLLSTAITNLGRTGINPQERDIYYGGDLAKWRAAAHSLKARFYLHVRNYPQAAAEARLGIASSDGDMLMPYDGTVSTSANPYYDFIDINRTGYMGAAGAYGVSLLQGQRDNARTNESARFEYFYTTEAGYSDVDPNILEGGAFAADADFPLITYVETQAILAEALARANDLTGALASLNNIRAYNRTTFTGGTYAAYTLADFASGGLLNTGQMAPADAATLRLWNSQTVAQRYQPNADGTYTFRGSVTDFGAGPVVADEQWYRNGLGNGFTGPAEQFIENVSYTRLREITLAYSLKLPWLKDRAKLQSVDVSLTGRNLALWTDYTGVDPETNLTGVSNGRGIDYFNNPSTRSYIMSLNFNF